MRVLSLFDGMACGMLAMQRAVVDVTAYYAYEVDKYAIKTATHNFSQILELGDVFNADFTKYNGIDYLIGGSPCTFWSIAQSPDKRETTASGIGWELFSQYVRALHEAKPKYFIYENNKSMSKEIRKSITETFGFEDICINSALVSAQNRQRLYWVGKRNEDGTYSKVNVEQPKDRGILLKDILDGNGYDLTSNDKAYTLTASYNGACAWNTIERSQRNMIIEPVGTTKDEKSYCLTQGYANGSGENRGYADRRWNYCQRPAQDDKAKCLVANISKGVPYNICAIPVKFENGIPTKAVSCSDGKTYTVHEVKGSQITIKGKTYPIKLIDGYYIIRKLTVSECKRLQTVPEWYEFPVSNTQAYKMLGNGWTVDVIAHLIQSIIKKENDK